jgi:chitodextrinase
VKARAPLILLTLLVSFLVPIMISNVQAASCPPGNCQVTVNTNVPTSDGSIYVEVDNNTSNIVALPQTFSFPYNTTHTLTVLNSTSFTGASTGGHYVWKDWANYYGTSTCPGNQCVWTNSPTVRICPGNQCVPNGVIYNYTGPAQLTAVFDKQYKATLSFTDVQGNPLTPAPTSLTLSGPIVGSLTISTYSGQYVSADDYTVVSAYWEGVRINPTTTTETLNLANGPATTTISLQAYPTTIFIVDKNNIAIPAASVTVTFVNSTSGSYTTDTNGKVNLGDIPNGSFGATVHYQNQAYGPYSLTAINNPTNTIQLNVTITVPPLWATGSAMTASSLTSTSLILSWPAASSNIGIVSYRVIENGVLIATVSGSITSFLVSGLTPGSSYDFQIEAIDCNDNTSTTTLSLIETTPLPPPWPTGSALTVSDVTSSGLVLSWPPSLKNASIASYRILENGAVVATISGNITSFLVTGLSSGNSYNFKVEAVDRYGNVSSTSLSVTETMPAGQSTSQQWLFLAVGIAAVLGIGSLSFILIRRKGRSDGSGETLQHNPAANPQFRSRL